jgi:hypothetical protein
MPIFGPTLMAPSLSTAYMSRIAILLLAWVRLMFIRAFKRRYEYNHLRNFRSGQAEKKIHRLMGLWALSSSFASLAGTCFFADMKRRCESGESPPTSSHNRSFDAIKLTLSVMSV